MFLSPFTPLNFTRHRHDGIDSRYVQTFASTDEIMIQIIGGKTWAGVAKVYLEPTHEVLWEIVWNAWSINGSDFLHFAVLCLSPGYYSVEIDGIGRSNVFRVTDDPLVLSNTTLVQYSMNSNRHRKDAVFFIDGMQRFFDFRVPGGFKDSNWTFAVEGEQFVTEESDIVQLYGIESTQKKFTLGNSDGCSVWYADMLNRILCCSYVYFDGERYARKDTSAPEPTVLLDGVDSFVFLQNLQRVVNMDSDYTIENQTIIRAVDSNKYRLSSTNTNRIIK